MADSSTIQPMTGLFGVPLEMVKTWVKAVPCFKTATANAVPVHLFRQPPNPLNVGYVWAEISYSNGGVSAARESQDSAVSGFNWTRRVDVVLARALQTVSDQDKADMHNLAGLFASQFLQQDIHCAIKGLALVDIILDTSIDPQIVGAHFLVTL